MSSPYWEYEENGVFYAFDPATNNHIESAYHRNSFSQITITIFSALFVIDLSACTMTDQRTLNVQKIRRTTPKQLPSIAQAMPKQRLYVWKYFNNGYRLFPEKDNVRIERLFLKNSRAKFRLESGGASYIIDFNNMTCVNEATTITHQLFRQDVSSIISGFDVPSAVNNSEPVVNQPKFSRAITKRPHPSEVLIHRYIGDLPKRPSFESFTIKTPGHKIFEQVTLLPRLRDDEFTHGDTCAVCLCDLCHQFPVSPPFKTSDEYNNLKVSSLPCGHVYHRNCILKALETRASCPVCKSSYQTVRGLQPEGTMTVSYSSSPVDGYPKAGSILITFNMEGGIQSSRHEHPGRRYEGDTRNHIMPATVNGFHALRWLALAWCQYLLFTVGFSPTRNLDDVITYGTIHLKTSSSGGSANHGWPDPSYFRRLHSECESAGLNIGPFNPHFKDRVPDADGSDDYLFDTSTILDDFDDDADKYGL